MPRRLYALAYVLSCSLFVGLLDLWPWGAVPAAMSAKSRSAMTATVSVSESMTAAKPRPAARDAKAWSAMTARKSESRSAMSMTAARSHLCIMRRRRVPLARCWRLRAALWGRPVLVYVDLFGLSVYVNAGNTSDKRVDGILHDVLDSRRGVVHCTYDSLFYHDNSAFRCLLHISRGTFHCALHIGCGVLHCT